MLNSTVDRSSTCERSVDEKRTHLPGSVGISTEKHRSSEISSFKSLLFANHLRSKALCGALLFCPATRSAALRSSLSFSLELLFDSVEMKERENSVWIPSNNSVLLLDCRRAASSIPSNERCIGTQTYFTRNGSADLSHSLARRRKQVGPVVFRVCSRRRWSNPNRTIAVRFSDAWIDFRRRITARYVDALLKIISLPTNISPNAINGLPTTNPFAIPAGRHGIDTQTRATGRATSYCQVFIRR